MGGIIDRQAMITWITDEDGNTQLEYGLNTSYWNEGSVDTSLVPSFSVVFSGLRANMTYHYPMKSKDIEGNITLRDDQTSETNAPAELTFTYIIISTGTGSPTELGQTGGYAVIFTDVDDDSLPDL